MSRRQKDPLRSLSEEERATLSRLSRSRSASSAQVARATALLGVADGQSYTTAAQRVGRSNGDTLARWVARFNAEGLAAMMPRHGGGPPICYREPQQQRILAEAEQHRIYERIPAEQPYGAMDALLLAEIGAAALEVTVPIELSAFAQVALAYFTEEERDALIAALRGKA